MDFETFFMLNDNPFRVNPEPKYFYACAEHQQALTELVGRIRSGEERILFIGEKGIGKTLTIHTLSSRLGEKSNAALVLNARLTPIELLKVLLEDLGQPAYLVEGRSYEELSNAFRDIVASNKDQEKNTVVIIDDAQNLPGETLEALKSMADDHEGEKSLQIMLSGRPELERSLRNGNFKPFSSRTSAPVVLQRLSPESTEAYLEHRYSVAGGRGGLPFNNAIIKDLHKSSGGIPRLINMICERALMAGFIDDKKKIDKTHLKKAVDSILGEEIPPPKPVEPPRPAASKKKYMIAAGVILACIIIAGMIAFLPGPEQPDPVQPSLTEPQVAPPQSVVQNQIDPAKEPETAVPENAALEPDQGDMETPGDARDEQKPVEEPKPVFNPMIPMPPRQTASLPPNTYLLTIDRDKETAYVWEGAAPSPRIRAEFRWQSPPEPGVYIVGENLKNRRFAFQPERLAFKGPAMPSTENWTEITKLLPLKAFPMISFNAGDAVKPEDVKKAAEIKTIINDWAETWRNRDAEKHMSYYGDRFTTYYDATNRTAVQTRDELFELKKTVFKSSGKITLALSDPVILIDPTDSRKAVAVFYQKYATDVYADEGTQALYFELAGKDHDSGVWRLTGKMFSLAEEPRRPEEIEPAKPEPRAATPVKPAPKPEPPAAKPETGDSGRSLKDL